MHSVKSVDVLSLSGSCPFKSGVEPGANLVHTEFVALPATSEYGSGIVLADEEYNLTKVLAFPRESEVFTSDSQLRHSVREAIRRCDCSGSCKLAELGCEPLNILDDEKRQIAATIISKASGIEKLGYVSITKISKE